VFLAGEAAAQPFAAPRVSANDTWTYQDTTESRAGWRQTRVDSTVVRAGPTEIVVSDKPSGSTMPPNEHLVGSDWSRARSVNGQQTVVNRPLAFPLSISKSWDVDYTDNQPGNRQHSSEHIHSVYKVTGWEDITVPAGTFHALKIEAEGTWSAVIAPSVGAVAGSRVDAHGATTVMQTGRTIATPVSGRTYKAFWYVPAVKRWVKADEEYYDTNGVRNERFLSELASYKVSD
jgi:hypothetical protein